MKCWPQVRAGLLAGIGGLSVGIILCLLLGMDTENSLFYLWTGVSGAISGIVANHAKEKAGWLSFGVGLVAGLIPELLFLPGYLSKIGGAGVFLLCFGAQIATGWGFYGPLGVWTTLLSGVSIFAGREMGPFWMWAATICALGDLLLTLDGFRDSSLRMAFHRKREHCTSGAPAELRHFHMGLCLCFLAGAVMIAILTSGVISGLLGVIKTGFTQGFHGILGMFNWVFRAIEWMIQWFSDLFPDIVYDPNPGDGEMPEGPVYTGGLGSALSTMIMVILFVVLCMAVTALVAGGILRARKKPKELEDVADYVDEVERLDRPRLFRRRKKKPRENERRITDPNQKLRFIFKKLLLKKLREDGMTVTKTPNELLDPTVAYESEVVEAYNLLRYGNRTVTPEQLEAAEQYLKNM